MNKTIHDIKTTPLIIVTNDCPIDIFKAHDILTDERTFEKCTECPFFVSDESCGYESYETPLITHESFTEPDDGTYGLPDTDYMWDFKCFKCGKTVRFCSGFSVMLIGNQERCRNCNTLHRYLKVKGNMHFFAIPIQDIDKGVGD